MALIFVMSSRRVPDSVIGLGISDKWLHLVEYAVLGFLLARAMERIGPWGVAPTIIGMLYGMSDEWHQSFVPGRDATLIDVVADTVGSAIGVLVWARLFGRRAEGLTPDATAPSEGGR